FPPLLYTVRRKWRCAIVHLPSQSLRLLVGLVLVRHLLHQGGQSGVEGRELRVPRLVHLAIACVNCNALWRAAHHAGILRWIVDALCRIPGRDSALLALRSGGYPSVRLPEFLLPYLLPDLLDLLSAQGGPFLIARADRVPHDPRDIAYRATFWHPVLRLPIGGRPTHRAAVPAKGFPGQARVGGFAHVMQRLLEIVDCLGKGFGGRLPCGNDRSWLMDQCPRLAHLEPPRPFLVEHPPPALPQFPKCLADILLLACKKVLPDLVCFSHRGAPLVAPTDVPRRQPPGAQPPRSCYTGSEDSPCLKDKSTSRPGDASCAPPHSSHMRFHPSMPPYVCPLLRVSPRET